MRDPLSWSVPLGRLFGVSIRVHWLFLVVAVGMVLRIAAFQQPPAPAGAWIDAAILLGFLFVSVLLHEFGHCFAARSVGGEATEILMWPLGGLASVELPQQPRAHLLTALAGPVVNLFLALAALLLLLSVHESWILPQWSILNFPHRDDKGLVHLATWAGEMDVEPYSIAALLNGFFWVNWLLFLLNAGLIAFPLDAGRIVQAGLWPRLGYRTATLVVVYFGYFLAIFVLAVTSLALNESMILALGLFVAAACYYQQFLLHVGDDGPGGYDFSQGYTSLERDAEPVPTAKPRQSWWQRWMQQRAEARARREAEQREAEERRMDELLEKVQREGLGALTEEERRFMKRVSERLRNKRT